MSTEVHLNTLVTEADEAYNKAAAALGDYKTKSDALKDRLLQDAGIVPGQPEPNSDDQAEVADEQEQLPAGDEKTGTAKKA